MIRSANVLPCNPEEHRLMDSQWKPKIQMTACGRCAKKKVKCVSSNGTLIACDSCLSLKRGNPDEVCKDCIRSRSYFIEVSVCSPDDEDSPMLPPTLFNGKPFVGTAEQCRKEYNERKGAQENIYKQHSRHRQYVGGACNGDQPIDANSLFLDTRQHVPKGCVLEIRIRPVQLRKPLKLNQHRTHGVVVKGKYVPLQGEDLEKIRKEERAHHRGERVVKVKPITIKIWDGSDEVELCSQFSKLGAVVESKHGLKGNARTAAQKEGCGGCMYGFGRNSFLGSYPGGKKIRDYKLSKEVYDELAPLSVNYALYLDRKIPEYLARNREIESKAHITPELNMGGEKGVGATGDISIDLYNEPHFDSNDAPGSVTLGCFTRNPPPSTLGEEAFCAICSRWQFILTDTYVSDDKGNKSDGIIIQLFHGINIAWPGQDVRHCTRKPRLPQDYVCSASPVHLLGTVWVPSQKLCDHVKRDLDSATRGKSHHENDHKRKRRRKNRC